jgi:peptidoglycan/LPS O-acetylase OafA/YrhL
MQKLFHSGRGREYRPLSDTEVEMMTANFKKSVYVLLMFLSSAMLSFYALTHVLQTRLLFGILLIAFAFVSGGISLYLPWSRGSVAHAFSTGIGIGLFVAAVAFFVPMHAG